METPEASSETVFQYSMLSPGDMIWLQLEKHWAGSVKHFLAFLGSLNLRLKRQKEDFSHLFPACRNGEIESENVEARKGKIEEKK